METYWTLLPVEKLLTMASYLRTWQRMLRRVLVLRDAGRI